MRWREREHKFHQSAKAPDRASCYRTPTYLLTTDLTSLFYQQMDRIIFYVLHDVVAASEEKNKAVAV
jgi:hypothetical protein